MIPEFVKLHSSEVELVLKAPILVCILIAGADGDIDRKEIKKAIDMVKAQKKIMSVLSSYFDEMAQDFEDKIKILIQNYPHESTKRNPLIIEELTQLNVVWLKLDASFRDAYYNMLKKLADQIASSSGGLWGIKTIASEEEKYLHLPMLIDPTKK